MCDVIVIGLPKQIGRIFIADFKSKSDGSHIDIIYADFNRHGTYSLTPSPGTAAHSLRNFFDKLTCEFDDALVIVLPYAYIPEDLEGELSAMQQMGIRVEYPEPGANDWPAKPTLKQPKLNHLSLTQINKNTLELIFDYEETISDVFYDAAEKNSRLLIVGRALDLCNDLPEHRHEFLQNAANAFLEFVEKNGQVGDLSNYFAQKKLKHAQSGGVRATLNVTSKGKSLYKETRQTHLKQGDNTDARAAVRIYYHSFQIEKLYYIAVLYVGPHPDDSMSLNLTYHLE